MTKKNTESSEEKDIEKEEDTNPADLEPDEDTVEEDDSDADPNPDEEEEEEGDENSDIDLDAEIEEENRRGPDPKKAHERIKDKEVEDDEEDLDEDDKPLTRREANELLAKQAKEAQETRAFDIARRLAGSDKEAELIVLKWKNRSFPAKMPLSEQVEEAYAITHRKRLISQRNEALRALKNRDGLNRTVAGTHRDSVKSNSSQQPKGMSKQDRQAIETSFGPWNPKTGRFEKKLKNGHLIVKYPGQDQVQTIKP